MRLSLSTTIFDIDGHVSVDVQNDTANIARMYRRASTVTTLDGGVVVTDRGASEVDLPLEFSWFTNSAAETSQIKDIIENYSRVLVSWSDGVYLATPETFEAGEEESRLVFLPIEKASV